MTNTSRKASARQPNGGRTNAASSNSGRSYAADPFFQRVNATIISWLESEWEAKAEIASRAGDEGWTQQLREARDAATLTAHSLAHRIDQLSVSTLQRELKKLGAPPVGDLIRAARLAYAKKLLTHGRLRVRQIAERCGYGSENHFTKVFTEATGLTPSAYRRNPSKESET